MARRSVERRADEQRERLARHSHAETSLARLALRAALRLLFCAALTYAVWRVLGTIALAVCAPLFGIALARPLMDLASHARAAVRHAALAPLAGRRFEHRGHLFDVVEDDEHERWLRADEVRKVIPAFPRDALLLRQYADGCRHDADGSGLRLRATTLLEYLARATEPASLKFRTWLEREVVLPSRKRSARRHGRAERPARETPSRE